VEKAEEGRGFGAGRKALAAVLLVAVLAGLGLLAGPYLSRLSREMTSLPNAPDAAESASADTARETPAAVPGVPESFPAAPSRMAEADPEGWLEGWVEAMNGTNAAVQASYYADPVDRYFLRSKVTRDAVLVDKEASIMDRREGWRMTVDKVEVAQRTATTARILLVKHIVNGPGAPTLRLRAQLKLKRVDGQWKISTEQTLG